MRSRAGFLTSYRELLAYLLVTLVFTYPLVLHFTTHTPDAGGEGSFGLWNLWHFRRGLLAGAPFSTTLIAPPFELNLVFHTYTISRNLLALPLLPVFGVVTTSNLLLLASFVLSAWGANLLVRDLTGDRGAAFVSGLVYAFIPYRFAHLSGHYQLVTMEWIPLYVLFAMRVLRGDGHRLGRPLGSGIALGSAALFALLTSLTDYYYGLFIMAITGIAVVYRLATEHDRAAEIRKALALGGAVLLVHLPLLGLMGWAYARGDWVGRPAGIGSLEALSADLAAFVTPSAQHPVFSEWAADMGSRFRAGFAEGTVYLGLAPLALAGAAALRFRRLGPEERLWVMAFGVFLLLALGPTLHVLGRPLVPLPGRLLAEVPVLREVRAPSRWVAMAALALAVLSGVTLAQIGKETLRVAGSLRVPATLRVSFAISIAAALILFEFLPAPLSLADRSVPAVYETIAADPLAGSVLDLPFGLNDSFTNLGGWNPQALYFQTVTGRPIVGAHVSRIPEEVFETYAGMPVIGTLARIEEGSRFTGAEVAAARAGRAEIVALLGLRYIVIPAGYTGSEAAAYVLEVFSGCLEPLAGDERAAGYRVGEPCSVTTP